MDDDVSTTSPALSTKRGHGDAVLPSYPNPSLSLPRSVGLCFCWVLFEGRKRCWSCFYWVVRESSYSFTEPISSSTLSLNTWLFDLSASWDLLDGEDDGLRGRGRSACVRAPEIACLHQRSRL